MAEDNSDRDTLEASMAYLERTYGPFDSVEVEDHGVVGWVLIGTRAEQLSVRMAVPPAAVVAHARNVGLPAEAPRRPGPR